MCSNNVQPQRIVDVARMLPSAETPDDCQTAQRNDEPRRPVIRDPKTGQIQRGSGPVNTGLQIAGRMRSLHVHLINKLGSKSIDEVAKHLMRKVRQGDTIAMSLLLKYMLGNPATPAEIESAEKPGLQGNLVFVFRDPKQLAQESQRDQYQRELAARQISDSNSGIIQDAEIVAES